MKKLLFLITIAVLPLISCKKDNENEYEQNEEPVCPCEEPTPLSSDGSIPDISWRNYNSVHDACFHYERQVKYGYFPNNTPDFDHSGDTLKVCGWLYDRSNTILHSPGNWISDNKKYASGNEPYPPKFDFGDGVFLDEESLWMSCPYYRDSIKYKCYITGIIKYYTYGSTYKLPCEWLRIKLYAIDIHFEENEK